MLIATLCFVHVIVIIVQLVIDLFIRPSMIVSFTSKSSISGLASVRVFRIEPRERHVYVAHFSNFGGFHETAMAFRRYNQVSVYTCRTLEVEVRVEQT